MGKLKLAQLLEKPEKSFERDIRDLETNPIFSSLRAAGVLAVQPYARARFAAQRLAVRELRASCSDNPELLDGRGDMARRIEQVGQENFEDCFLRDEALSDDERAKRCGISVAAAKQLREFVDNLYIQSELQSSALDRTTERPTEITLSAVAAIEIDQGQPVLGFFNREIWKGRYKINNKKLQKFLASLHHRQARKTEAFLRQLEYIDYRKSTLYATLERLLEHQAPYFLTRDPGHRRPLTQSALAVQVGSCPTVINRLISNKSIRLPWGMEAPLGILFPSAKSLMRDRLYDLAMVNPGYCDEELRQSMTNLYGARLSRQSITQYRRELGVARSTDRFKSLRSRGA